MIIWQALPSSEKRSSDHSGALLHDIGKTKELSAFSSEREKDEGQLLGHIIIGSQMIHDLAKEIPDFPEVLENELTHCISHITGNWSMDLRKT